MTNLEQNRKALFDKLVSLDYLKEDDGTLSLTFEEFAENLNDEESLSALYQNLAEDGLFCDATGKVLVTEQNFINQFGGHRMPSTAIEKKLFNEVAEILNTEDFGVNTNLFSLGLTSISAIRLSSWIDKEYAVKVTVVKINEFPSVEELAGLIESSIKASTVARKGNPLF